MISLKTKKNKKKIIKGGVINDNEDNKKVIFDALFELYNNILNDDYFKKELYIDNDTTIIYNKYNKLYIIFKFFFSSLFNNVFNDTDNDVIIFNKMSKYFIITYYNTTTENTDRLIFNNNISSIKAEYIKEPLKILDIKELFNFSIVYINKDMLIITINGLMYMKTTIQLKTDLVCYDNSKLNYNKYDIESLLIILYNFIIENYNYDNFKEFIKNFRNIDNFSSDIKTTYKTLIDDTSIELGIFKNSFNNIFKPSVLEFNYNIIEENLNNKYINDNVPLNEDEKDILIKKATRYQNKTLDLIYKNNLNENLILNALECFKYYNLLNDYDNSIIIIKKILDLKFDDSFKTKEYYKLYLILALLYYYSATNNFNIDNYKDISKLHDFNNYINKLLFAIHYLKFYFTNIILNNGSNTSNIDIRNIIENSIKKYNEYEINILKIYNKIINDICTYISNIKDLEDANNNRELLQLLLLAYSFYKKIFDINIISDIGIDNKLIIYPLKDNNQSEETLDNNKLKELLDKPNKNNLLSKLIAQIEHFKTTELLRLFFFRKQTEPNSFYVDKITEFGIIRDYDNYIQKINSTPVFIDNIFNEILLFDINKPILPYGLDVLFSIYKYNFQLPLNPSDDNRNNKDKYNNYVLEVFKNKENNKEQYEFFKTLLNIFYMNISILYYNLFTDKQHLFEDLKKEINDKSNINETTIKKDDILKIIFKEENKAEIISLFIYHLRMLFNNNNDIIVSDNISFLLILFNNLYTSNIDDLMKFIYAMYNKLFKLNEENYLIYKKQEKQEKRLKEEEQEQKQENI